MIGKVVVVIAWMTSAVVAQSFDSPPLDWIDRDESGAYQFGYATGDEGKHYHVSSASANNQVTGRFGYKDPETGRDLQTVYTAGRKGFRARGPHIARRMDLSQNRPPFARPNKDGKYIPELDNVFDPNEDKGYDFSYRSATHSKEEHADRNGDVQGRYSYVDDVGNRHTVDYIAGSRTGFVVTNAVPDTFARARGGPLYYVGKRGSKIRGFHAIQKALDGSYRFEASGPDHKRSEVSDAAGNRRGTYTYLDDKGIQHTVEYIAGPKIGYKVINNKKGTAYNPVLPFFPDSSTLGPFSPSFPTSTFRPIVSSPSSGGFGGGISGGISGGHGGGLGSGLGGGIGGGIGGGSGSSSSSGSGGLGGGSKFPIKPTEPTKFPVGPTGSTTGNGVQGPFSGSGSGSGHQGSLSTSSTGSDGSGFSGSSPSGSGGSGGGGGGHQGSGSSSGDDGGGHGGGGHHGSGFSVGSTSTSAGVLPGSSYGFPGSSPTTSPTTPGSGPSSSASPSPSSPSSSSSKFPKPTQPTTPFPTGPDAEDHKWNYNPVYTHPKDWSMHTKPESGKKPRPGGPFFKPTFPDDYGTFHHSFFGDDDDEDDGFGHGGKDCSVNGTRPWRPHYRGSIKFGGIRRSGDDKEKREEFFEIPPGVAVRAHVQSLDIVPLRKRYASPSEALEELSKRVGRR